MKTHKCWLINIQENPVKYSRYKKRWYVCDTQDDAVYINYCPYCGIKLEKPELNILYTCETLWPIIFPNVQATKKALTTQDISASALYVSAKIKDMHFNQPDIFEMLVMRK